MAEEDVKPYELNFEDVMVDLETLGTKSGCTILSIGAVAFDANTNRLGPEFYIVINHESCMEAGLVDDPNTVAWWSKQSDEAKVVLTEATEGGESLEFALGSFSNYLEQFGLKNVKVWGNGSDFDNVILNAAYQAIGSELPWRFYNNRCFRTLRAIGGNPKMLRQGTYHNALDDAKTQTACAIGIFQQLQILKGDYKSPIPIKLKEEYKQEFLGEPRN